MRNGTRTTHLIIALIFIILLLLPLFVFRFTGAEENATEKRLLMDYPSIQYAGRRFLSRELQQETEDWINDHIGFRDLCRQLYFRTVHGMLKLSTVESVVFGKEGWLFYTQNNNLSIAKGTYPLTDEKTRKIIENQKQIYDDYRARGLQYHLLLTPSKVRVYSEYLPFNTTDIDHSPADLIENAMLLNGAPYVINIGPVLIGQKAEHHEDNLFFKTDSHWNATGSYYAYVCAISHMKEDETAINVTFSDKGTRQGDLNQMLGLTGKEYCETAPQPEYEWQSNAEKPDEKMIEIVQRLHKKQGNSYSPPLVYCNKNKTGSGTLVIYGDSMMGEWLFFPRYMAEHFEKVVVLRLRSPEKEIDDYLGATHVLLQTTERLILPTLL